MNKRRKELEDALRLHGVTVLGDKPEIAVLEDILAVLEGTAVVVPVDDRPSWRDLLGYDSLGTRTFNALCRSGVTTVEDFLAKDVKWFRAIPQIGDASIQLIQQAITSLEGVAEQ